MGLIRLGFLNGVRQVLAEKVLMLQYAVFTAEQYIQETQSLCAVVPNENARHEATFFVRQAFAFERVGKSQDNSFSPYIGMMF